MVIRLVIQMFAVVEILKIMFARVFAGIADMVKVLNVLVRIGVSMDAQMVNAILLLLRQLQPLLNQLLLKVSI